MFTYDKILGMMELHRLEELPDRLDQSHSDLAESAHLACILAGVLTDSIMMEQQHVTLENHGAVSNRNVSEHSTSLLSLSLSLARCFII